MLEFIPPSLFCFVFCLHRDCWGSYLLLPSVRFSRTIHKGLNTFSRYPSYPYISERIVYDCPLLFLFSLGGKYQPPIFYMPSVRCEGKWAVNQLFHGAHRPAIDYLICFLSPSCPLSYLLFVLSLEIWLSLLHWILICLKSYSSNNFISCVNTLASAFSLLEIYWNSSSAEGLI